MIELFSALIILIFVLFLTYYVTMFIAKHGGGFGKSNYMQIIDRLSIDRNNTLVIVKIASEYQVLLVNSHNSINLGMIEELDEEVINKKDFKSIYDKILNRKGVSQDE